MSSPSGPAKLVTHPPPPHFHPGRANDEELSQAGYPPRPNPDLAPKLYARWQSIATQNPQYVQPELSDGEWDLLEAHNWAGAVLYASPRRAQSDPNVPKDPFTTVVGSWVLPKIHPVKRGPGSNDYEDGEYRLWTWVGIDGWTNKVSLKSGVTSALTVQNGKITSETSQAALIYQDSDTDIRVKVFENFTVDPGDLITGEVWTTTDGGSVTGHARVHNFGRNEFSTASLENTPLQGVTAEWIVAGSNPGASQPYKFPDFGATHFFAGLAIHAGGKENSLDRSELIDAEDVGSFATRTEDQVLILVDKVVKKPS